MNTWQWTWINTWNRTWINIWRWAWINTWNRTWSRTWSKDHFFSTVGRETKFVVLICSIDTIRIDTSTDIGRSTGEYSVVKRPPENPEMETIITGWIFECTWNNMNIQTNISSSIVSRNILSVKAEEIAEPSWFHNVSVESWPWNKSIIIIIRNNSVCSSLY